MPPKRAATSPAPIRRTPRKSAGTSPARLGLTDTWGTPSANHGWVSSDPEVKAKEEEEKIKERTKKVAAQNKADDQKHATSENTSNWYQSTMKQYPILATSVQGALFATVGEVIATVAIKEQPFDQTRAICFAVWGAILVRIMVPYLAFMSTFRAPFPESATFNALAKTVVDQLTMGPLLVVTFMVYFKIAVEGMAMDAIFESVKTEFATRYALTASYWACVNFSNFMLVPHEWQLLVVNAMGLVWGIASSYIT